MKKEARNGRIIYLLDSNEKELFKTDAEISLKTLNQKLNILFDMFVDGDNPNQEPTPEQKGIEPQTEPLLTDDKLDVIGEAVTYLLQEGLANEPTV